MTTDGGSELIKLLLVSIRKGHAPKKSAIAPNSYSKSTFLSNISQSVNLGQNNMT